MQRVDVGVESVAIRSWLGKRKGAVTNGPFEVEMLFGTVQKENGGVKKGVLLSLIVCGGFGRKPL